MDANAIENAISEMTKRISNLESFQWNDYVATGLSVIAVAFSIAGFWVSSRNSKRGNLLAIKTGIDAAKQQMESLGVELAPLKAKRTTTADEKRELAIKEKAVEAALERLLGCYEYGCGQYYKNLVIAFDFEEMYHSDLVKYVEAFPDKFTEPLTGYKYMNKYYKSKHKRQ